MTHHLFIFGIGYTALRLAQTVQRLGWRVSGTVRSEKKASWLQKLGINARVDDISASHNASHMLSSVPPFGEWAQGTPPDAVLKNFSDILEKSSCRWLGYLSTTGVYGDTGGAMVDETAPTGGGRNKARDAADEMWRALSAPIHIFRLPGIYGPGRSQLERAEKGRLNRIDKPGQVFCRIHVDDIVQALIASMHTPTPGEVFNIVDDLPAPSHEVEDYACQLLGLPCPPLQPFETAELSPMARSFYAQNRRVSNVKMKEMLGIDLIYPTYKEGLNACLAERALPLGPPKT